MITKIISLFLVCIILISFISCSNASGQVDSNLIVSSTSPVDSSTIVSITEPVDTTPSLKTGEISTHFPDSFSIEKNEFNQSSLITELKYHLGPEWYNKKINFRQHIEVNDDTTWVLSKDSKGTEIIDNFTITLTSRYNTYFILCYDKIGYLSTYKITLYVEYEIKRYFFTYIDYDYITDYIKSHSLEIQNQYGLSTPELKFIGYNLPTVNKNGEFIMGHIFVNTEFFQRIEGENFPTENPSREGYIFDGWEEFNHPKYGKIFSEHGFLFLENNYLPKVYVAKWIPVQ